MAGKEKLHFHLEHFDPEEYLADFDLRRDLKPGRAAFYRDLAEMFHEVFSGEGRGEGRSEGRGEGAAGGEGLGGHLLDVGSGPTLWHLMSASGRYGHVTQSDPLPQNRRMLERYMENEGEDARWIGHFKLTAKLEGAGEAEKAWRQVGARLRCCVREVIPCDILEEYPLGKERHGDRYDCVMSSLCLEAACADVKTYNAAVRRLVAFAKAGGKIVIGGTSNATFYELGGKRFQDLAVSPETIQAAVQGAGCTVTRFLFRDTAYEASDNTGIFVLEARKHE